MKLYRAIFRPDLDKRPFDWRKEPEKAEAWFISRRFTVGDIRFLNSELLDRKGHSQFLIKHEDGSTRWEGTYAPHSPYAMNQEDALQMLRWENMGHSNNLEAYNGSIDSRDNYHAYFRHRKHLIEEVLRLRGISPVQPWWEKKLTRSYWL